MRFLFFFFFFSFYNQDVTCNDSYKLESKSWGWRSQHPYGSSKQPPATPVLGDQLSPSDLCKYCTHTGACAHTPSGKTRININLFLDHFFPLILEIELRAMFKLGTCSPTGLYSKLPNQFILELFLNNCF